MRYCLTLDLHRDEVIYEIYDRYHETVWPEVLDHLRSSGIEDMTIWRYQNRLVMLIEANRYFKFEHSEVGPDTHHRVVAWRDVMGALQRSLSGEDRPEWERMKEVFRLSEQNG
ncbi:L-rhamnose mutarotase [Paraburkholderia fungorum]|uniref:L-rhamnose mutarotase n=1 Tax=Paraburkholderia fungorum TaxID=134537 RepID=UPI000E70EFE9